MVCQLKRTITIGLFFTTIFSAIHAFAPTHFFEPYDPNLRMIKAPKKTFRLGINAESATSSRVRNVNSKVRNILQINDAQENVVAMLQKPTATANAIGTIPPSTTIPTTTNNTGLVNFDGSFEQNSITLFGQYTIPVDLFSGDTSIFVALPIRSARINVRNFNDLTTTAAGSLDTTETDFNNAWTKSHAILQTQVAPFGLDLQSWEKTGLGDLTVMLQWARNFPQNKELLKNVDLYTQFGLCLPTSSERNIDRVFSIALGNDGALAIPIGMGMGLHFIKNIKIGTDVEFLTLCDKTGQFRMKTDKDQSDFLLINKGRATMDYGFTWKFNLYTQIIHFWKGFSFKSGYEYIKHDDDTLIPKTNEFNHDVINNSNSLKEWNTHNILLQLNCDGFKNRKNPFRQFQVSHFVKIPIGGKRVINPLSYGCQIAYNF